MLARLETGPQQYRLRDAADHRPRLRAGPGSASRGSPIEIPLDPPCLGPNTVMDLFTQPMHVLPLQVARSQVETGRSLVNVGQLCAAKRQLAIHARKASVCLRRLQ